MAIFFFSPPLTSMAKECFRTPPIKLLLFFMNGRSSQVCDSPVIVLFFFLLKIEGLIFYHQFAHYSLFMSQNYFIMASTMLKDALL